jgi:drug/metabolite transporter (DMT)-like permease
LKPKTLPSLALAFGILAVSMAAILVRWANAPATVMGFWRMCIAALVMAIPVYATRNTHYAPGNFALAILAGLFFALNLAAWNTSALNTTAANVTLLGNLSVVWVPLVTMFVFKRKLRGAFWLGLACAILGVVIILSYDLLAHPVFGIGDVWGIAASVVYSGYLLTMEQARKHLSALVAWWISTATSALGLLALSLLLGASLTDYSLATFVIFAIMAIVLQIGGFLSLNYALGHLPAPIVSTSLLAQPVLTALLAIPLLGQSIGLVQLIGGVLVLGGIVIVHKSRMKYEV